MVRVLYGVAGEGSGHSSRARVIINHLIGRGHEVRVVSYGQGYENLKSIFEVEKIFGLRFFYEQGRIKKRDTFFKNLKSIPEASAALRKVLDIIDHWQPGLVFSDFEPLSCIAANLKRIPLVSIDNQHRITNARINYPQKYKKEAQLAKAVINLMIFNSKACLVTSFFKARPTNKKTFFFPPILRNEILSAQVSEGDFVLVYFTSSEFKPVLDILRSLDQLFIVYGFGGRTRDSNLLFRDYSQEGFVKDLVTSRAVVASAGFTLITESLYLGKPYFAIPVAGQFEQVLNAYYLKKLGYGDYSDEPNKKSIENFLYDLDKYRANLRHYPRENNSKIFNMIDLLIEQHTSSHDF